jgi:polyisoprenoid-binding protein YceI
VTTWIFEPGHTELAFRARHMMVTWVRGAFKDVHGKLEFDWDRCLEATFTGWTDVEGLWTGEPTRDAHLKSADFFDAENHPRLEFEGRLVERLGDIHFRSVADVTIRGNTREVPFEVTFTGQWEAPFWVGDENRGMMRRIGFEGRTSVNRQDFGVSWQDALPGGGVVASDLIVIALDVEGIALEDLEKTGAIDYYREDVEKLVSGSAARG